MRQHRRGHLTIRPELDKSVNRNRKYDVVHINLMRRDPDKIMVCPICYNIFIKKYYNYVPMMPSKCWRFKCANCGFQFIGRYFLLYQDSLKNKIQKFFSTHGKYFQNMDNFYKFIKKENSGWWYHPGYEIF